MGKIIFVTYASGTYKKNIFWNRLFISLFIRPDVSLFFTDEDLKKTDMYRLNRDIFDARTGGGYWAWKPWVISQAIESAQEGDIVIYQDCGKGFKYKNIWKPKNIINYAKQYDAMPGILVPIHGKNKQWTHKKCFELMECCEEKYYDSPQVEAVISAWKVGEKSKSFVKEWFSCCLNLGIVGDSSEKNAGIDNTFIMHRYDQSILTNLVIKYNLKPVKLTFNDMHFSKSMSLVDLDLGRNKYFKAVLLKLFRLKRIFRDFRSPFVKNIEKYKYE